MLVAASRERAAHSPRATREMQAKFQEVRARTGAPGLTGGFVRSSTVAISDWTATDAKRVEFATNVANQPKFATYEESGREEESSSTMTYTEADLDARVMRNLARFREHANLTQEALGAKLDPPVRRNEINRWENKRPPKRITLLQMADVLGIDPGLFWTDPGLFHLNGNASNEG
jgi:hypothetical protein